jgi:hypothetical protein
MPGISHPIENELNLRYPESLNKLAVNEYQKSRRNLSLRLIISTKHKVDHRKTRGMNPILPYVPFEIK